MPPNYFNRLNYTLGDEDSSVEMAILPLHCGTVCTVAGSGGRVLPLLAKAPAKLIVVDIVPEQLHLTALRVAAIKALDLNSYRGFWGIPGSAMSPKERREIFHALELDAAAVDYLKSYFEHHQWNSILLTGKFEQTLVTLSKVNRLVTGAKGRALLEQADLGSQRAYLADRFPYGRWKMILALLGNSTVLNSLLYKGDFPKKNIPGSTYANFKRIFDALFNNIWLRESFFAQLCFFGELIYAEAALIECDPQHFEAIKQGALDCQIDCVQGDILKVIRDRKEDIDFVSLSDVPSFLQGEIANDYLQLMREYISPGGKVVVRGNLRVTQPNAAGFSRVNARYEDIFKAEKTQLWKCDVYEKDTPSSAKLERQKEA